MRSIFRYPGGKSKDNVRTWIMEASPDAYVEYREPFVGGGGVYFGIHKIKKRWINDVDEELISVYRALQCDSDKFIELCRAVPAYDDKKAGERDRLAAVFHDLIQNITKDRALRYFFINRTVFGGRVNYHNRSRLFFSNPEGWSNSILDLLQSAATLLQNTNITCGSYEAVFLEPGDRVWIYADPPYVMSLDRSSQLYCHIFDDEDHERLASIIKKCPHKVALSYEDDKRGLVRKLYKGFKVVEKEWVYSGTRAPNSAGVDKKRVGKELLILNY